MRLLFWTVAAIFVADQALKYYVVHHLQLATRLAIDVWPPFLNLRMAWNEGINFGLFDGMGDAGRWILIAIAIAICTWVLLWIRRGTHPAIVYISAGFLLGGAFGNIVDRIVYGAVADFLNMSCCGIRNPFAFNVADIAIFVGAIGLVFFAGQEKTP